MVFSKKRHTDKSYDAELDGLRGRLQVGRQGGERRDLPEAETQLEPA